MKDSKFVVSEFTNPSGEIVYRLYGRVDGERSRLREYRAAPQLGEPTWGGGPQMAVAFLAQIQNTGSGDNPKLTDRQLAEKIKNLQDALMQPRGSRGEDELAPPGWPAVAGAV